MYGKDGAVLPAEEKTSILVQGTLISIVGESLVDVIATASDGDVGATYPGGSPLNVAVGTARLGLPTKLVTQFAPDEHGQLIQDHLESSNVEVSNFGLERTSVAEASIGSGGSADYDFSIEWNLGTGKRQLGTEVRGSMHIHTGSIASAMMPGATSVLTAIAECRGGSTISYDPNCRPALCPDASQARRQAELFVQESDLVKASDEDLAWLYPDRSPEETMAAWLELGPAFIAVTRGDAGTVFLSRQGRVEVGGEKIALVDTVGAGDSFMSGLLAGLAQLGALGAEARPVLNALTLDQAREVVSYANRAAGITCSRAGANPPNADELGMLLGS
ncbi:MULTISPECIES: carbohydrate kinase [Micrococcaceae]|uniref:carbohydrate kinase family protein n=1 Tax=Micrococcaceae TaxID=1268 RepID=UPI0010355B56|nr:MULTISPECIES: carbohydrate kinase [Micrococcaceae]TAP25740.1 carbohydrate kinase [Arthrobacter sp. S41]UXN31678.1 carbohydrate kinase [Glutamicibacter sp. M10]